MFQTLESNISRKGLTGDSIAQVTRFASVSDEVGGDPREDPVNVESSLQFRSLIAPSDKPLLIRNLLDLDVAHMLNGSCPLVNCADVGSDHSRIR